MPPRAHDAGGREPARGEFKAASPKGDALAHLRAIESRADAFANASWACMAERLGLMNRRLDKLGLDPVDDLGLNLDDLGIKSCVLLLT